MAEAIDVKLEFDDSELLRGIQDLQKALGGLQKQLTSFEKKQDEALNDAAKNSKKAAKGIDDLSAGFKRGVARVQQFAAVVGVTFSAAVIGQQIKRGVDLAIAYEQTTVAFETFLGSATAATAVLEELNQFSIATPFEPTQVIEAGQSLLAFGFEASEVTTQLQRIGDISAGVNTDFNELAVIFGKARISGRLFAEDINQLTERGIPIISELASQFGVAEKEVKKLVESGQVEFANLEEAFINLTSEGGKFFGLINKQSQTLGGRISTLAGNFDGLLKAIGERLLPVVGNVVDAFNRFTRTAKEFVEVPVSAQIEQQRVALNALVLQITDTNIEEAEKLQLINDLNAEYPDFLGNLEAEKVTNEELAGRLEAVNDELINKIVLQRKSEELQKAADAAADARIARAEAEAEANLKIFEANEKLGLGLDLTNKSLEERQKLLEEATAGTRLITASTRDFGNQLTAEGLRIDRATKAIQAATEARAEEIRTAEDLKRISNDRIQLAQDLGLSLEGLTQAEQEAAIEARKRAEEEKRLELEAQQRADRRAKAQKAAEKAEKDRAKLLAELTKLTERLAKEADESRIDAETDLIAQSEKIRDAQKAEIELLRQTIEEKAKEAGKEVDITNDINALIQQAEREHEQRVSDIRDEELKKRTEAIEKQAQEEADSRAFQINQELEFLDKQRQIKEAEVELIEKSTDETLSLEQFKQQQLLQAELQFNQQRLRLFADRFGPESQEVQLLEAQIEVIKKKLSDIGKGDPEDIFGNLAGKLGKALGLDEDELKTLVDGVQKLFGEVFNAVRATTDAAIEQNQRLIESIDDRIDAAQSAFDNEVKLAEAGLANSVNLKKQELELLNEERQKALQQQEELTRQQNRLDTLQQTVSLITASANIFQSLSPLGPIGIGIALATIGVMFGGFIAAKAKAAQATQQLAEGGQIEGRSHAEGGHRIEGTNLEVEGGEWVVNKGDSAEHTRFLKRLNSGEFKGMNLNAMMDGKMMQSGNFGTRLGDNQRDIQTRQEQARQDAHNKQLAESIDKQTQEIVSAIDKKPVIIQTEDGYIMKRTINGKEHTRRVRR